jgi:predicted small lipoprotein YifL
LNNPVFCRRVEQPLGGCRVDRSDYRPVRISRMEKLLTRSILISTLLIALLGCASSGPSPEQQVREADQQREAERQQKEFRKSLPPVSNPGQGW